MHCILLMIKQQISTLIDKTDRLLQQITNDNVRETLKERLNKSIGPYRSDEQVLRSLTMLLNDVAIILYYQGSK